MNLPDHEPARWPKCEVTQAYQSEFAIAPKATPGSRVHFERLDPKNPAWFFGRDPAGVCGYFPVAWFELDGASARAMRSYDATELTVPANSFVKVIERYGQWVLAIDESGTQGWLPEECIMEKRQPDSLFSDL